MIFRVVPSLREQFVAPNIMTHVCMLAFTFYLSWGGVGKCLENCGKCLHGLFLYKDGRVKHTDTNMYTYTPKPNFAKSKGVACGLSFFAFYGFDEYHDQKP